MFSLMLSPSHGIPRPHSSLSKCYSSGVTKTSSFFGEVNSSEPCILSKDKLEMYFNIKIISGEKITEYLSDLKLGKAILRIHKGTVRYHFIFMDIITKF